MNTRHPCFSNKYYSVKMYLKNDCKPKYNTSLVDIDECSRNYCQQKCKNFPGGYKCSCYKGYHQHRWYAGRCTGIEN